MIIVIPLASCDADNLERHLACLERFRPNPEQDFGLIIPTPDANRNPQFLDAIARYRACFGVGRCDLMELPNTPDGGWPVAPNIHFQFAVIYVRSFCEHIGQFQPWMWLETDALPCRDNWTIILMDEYRNAGKPFLGVEYPTIVYEDGVKMIEGTHMMGVAIYPADYQNHPCERRNGSPPAAWQFPRSGEYGPATSFTINCRHEHWPFFNTKLIVHHPRTKNWRVVSGTILECEEVESKFPLGSGGRVDIAGAVLIHGCKDESLAELILGDKPKTQEPGPAFTAEAEEKKLGISQSAEKCMSCGSTESIQHPFPNVSVCSLCLSKKQQEEDMKKKPAPPTDEEQAKIKGFFSDKTGKKKLSDIANETGITEQRLREIGCLPESLIDIAAFGWTSLRHVG